LTQTSWSGFGRHEVHLDRTLERMLTMLLRLKDLRLADPFGKSQAACEGPSWPGSYAGGRGPVVRQRQGYYSRLPPGDFGQRVAHD
jgi:hypothetical protein